jgi:hypothetical protein
MNSHSTFIFVAKRLGDIDVEAGQLSVGADCVEGRVGAFRADPDLGPLLVLRLRGACQRQHGGGGKRDAGELTHCISLFSLRSESSVGLRQLAALCRPFSAAAKPLRHANERPRVSGGRPMPENAMKVTGSPGVLAVISSGSLDQAVRLAQRK